MGQQSGQQPESFAFDDDFGKEEKMASVQEKIKGGKIVSYKFRACLGRDENGKQIFKSTTWYPPSDLTNARSRKAAVIAAEEWEQQIKSGIEPEANNSQATIKESQYTFEQFVTKIYG